LNASDVNYGIYGIIWIDVIILSILIEQSI